MQLYQKEQQTLNRSLGWCLHNVSAHMTVRKVRGVLNLVARQSHSHFITFQVSWTLGQGAMFQLPRTEICFVVLGVGGMLPDRLSLWMP